MGRALLDYGLRMKTIVLEPRQSGWTVTTAAGVEPLWFLRPVHAEKAAYRLARAMAQSDDRVQVLVRNPSRQTIASAILAADRGSRLRLVHPEG